MVVFHNPFFPFQPLFKLNKISLEFIFTPSLIGNKTSCRPIRSVIILEMNKMTPAARLSNFVITRMITERIGLQSVLLPLLIISYRKSSICWKKVPFTLYFFFLRKEQRSFQTCEDGNNWPAS